MSEAFDSIYPDLLRTGLGKLTELNAHSELQSLFLALEHFRRDLHEQESAAGILEVSQGYIAGLNLFRTTGFYLVDPADFGFELALCAPGDHRQSLDEAVQKEIQTGRFAWALRQSSPVFLQSARGVLHSLTLSNQVLGMFCGLLEEDLKPVREIAFSLLSVLLGASADALGTLRKTTQLAGEIQTLSGLLPICAWCKRVRDDRGYWEQIERYVETRSEALFSHGICPDCKHKHFPD